MQSNLHRTVLLALILLSLPAMYAEQSSDATPRLTIATASGQSTFHIGERIPLVLSFTGPDDKSFAIDLAGYDRSGRMYEDTFNVQQDSGWVDPLAAYFRYGMYMGGGMRTGATISSKPETVKVNLNEWVRFDEPGTYSLTVTSHRVGHSHRQQEDGMLPRDRIDLTSTNTLMLTIVPATREWEEQTLKRIVRDLPSPAEPQDVSDAHRAAEENAINDLRFLAAAPAVRLLAAKLNESSGMEWPAYFGLLGLPYRDHEPALLVMRSLLNSPNFPVGEMFLEAMSWLQMPEADERSAGMQSDLKVVAQRYQQNRIRARDVEWRNLLLAMREKKGEARRVSAATLLATRPSQDDPGSMAILAPMMRELFAHMSEVEQARMLDEDWELIASRELLPKLRAIAKAPPGGSDTHPIYTPRYRIAIALRRWYEFEPEAAAAETIRQIGKTYPQLYAKEVSFLPDRAFPEFETLWAKTLAEGEDINDYEPAASLLLRYGTGMVSAQMVDIILHPKDKLGNRVDPALAYLFKFDPDGARALGQQNPDFLSGSLSSIAKNAAPSPFLTAAAIRALDHPDPAEVMDALNYLRQYGDEHVREPLYSAFLHWYEHNRHFADADLSDLSSEASQQIRLGDDFAVALLCNQGWLADAKLKSDVLQHTIGSSMHSQADTLTHTALEVTAFAGAFASYEIGCYRAPTLELFLRKLDQFPSGTSFTLQHVSSDRQQSQKQLEDSLPALFLKHGMKLVVSDSSGIVSQ